MAMFRGMFRRDYPETALAQRETRREKRLFAMLIGIPALLFLTFTAFYFAPWEIAYREHGATILRAQVEALPPYNTDRQKQVNSLTLHGD
jgi:hypothetical protein